MPRLVSFGILEAQKELLENLITEKLISLEYTGAKKQSSDYCNRDIDEPQCSPEEYLVDLKKKLEFAHGGRRVYSKKTRKNRKH
jgi:hypothetical protein